MFFENGSKLDQTLVMPVMPVGPDRIIDITDVSGSRGALRYGYAMPVVSAGGECLTDIAESANVEANRGILSD